MDLDLGQLRALSAVAAEGTFDAAARLLHVTPSAISQRIRALEIATGRVLLVRSKPVVVTPPGHAVLRLARQIEALATDTGRELGLDDSSVPLTVPIAVNADSLATWALPALAPLADTLCFEIHREDQEHTSTLLRDGTVMAAVTADAEPVPGCRSTPLGSMRYRPLAEPSFAERWFPDGPTTSALAAAPVVVFDRKDDLQHRYLRRRSRSPLAPPVQQVPSSAEFLTAVRLGLGWGMVPDQQGAKHRRAGRLVELDPRGVVDVALHWQQWRLPSTALSRVTDAVVTAARAALHPPGV
jgi:LysR family transcriptional regulator (chromosome initiation inhibitor)